MTNETTFILNGRADQCGLVQRGLSITDESALTQHGLSITTFIEEPVESVVRESAENDSTVHELVKTSPVPSVSANPSKRRQVAVPEAKIEELEKRVRELEEHNKILLERGKKLAHELDIFRHRRLVYWSDRFRNRFDAWHLMHPGFEETKDDTMLFQGDLKGFRLLPSLNLVRLSSLRYELNLERTGLCAILLAPILDMPSTAGEVCIRITDSRQLVLVEVSVPISKITEEQPCEFYFPSLGDISLNKLSVHIFTQGVDVPVRIFELKKYPRFGFARLQRKLFAGFRFTE
jgi:hypothetical protein